MSAAEDLLPPTCQGRDCGLPVEEGVDLCEDCAVQPCDICNAEPGRKHAKWCESGPWAERAEWEREMREEQKGLTR